MKLFKVRLKGAIWL